MSAATPEENFEAMKIQDRLQQCQAQKDQLLKTEHERNRAAAEARAEKIHLDKEIQLAEDAKQALEEKQAKDAQQALEERQHKLEQDKQIKRQEPKGKERDANTTSIHLEVTNNQGRLVTLLLERVSRRLMPIPQVQLLPLDPNLP